MEKVEQCMEQSRKKTFLEVSLVRSEAVALGSLISVRIKIILGVVLTISTAAPTLLVTKKWLLWSVKVPAVSLGRFIYHQQSGYWLRLPLSLSVTNRSNSIDSRWFSLWLKGIDIRAYKFDHIKCEICNEYVRVVQLCAKWSNADYSRFDIQNLTPEIWFSVGSTFNHLPVRPTFLVPLTWQRIDYRFKYRFKYRYSKYGYW